MKAFLRQPDKKVKLTKENLFYLLQWLQKASKEGFTGINDYSRLQEKREEFMKYSLTTFIEKVVLKNLQLSRHLNSKKITINIDYPEELTLLMLFNRVDCDQYVNAVQSSIIMQLRTEKIYQNVYKRIDLNQYINQ